MPKNGYIPILGQLFADLVPPQSNEHPPPLVGEDWLFQRPLPPSQSETIISGRWTGGMPWEAGSGRLGRKQKKVFLFGAVVGCGPTKL